MHMIDYSKGFAGIAYANEAPWHSLGQQVDPAAPIEVWKKNGGIDFDVLKQRYFWPHPGGLLDANGNPVQCVSDDFALIRSDTGGKLGICTDRYKILQPSTVMEFYRDLTQDHGFTMETVGSLDGGKKIWALAKVSDGFRVKGQDQVAEYVLLSTSYDSSIATVVMFTSVRVVCWNTLKMAYNGAQDCIRISHKSEFDHRQVKIDLGIYGEARDEFQNRVEALAEVKISDKEAMRFIVDVLEGKNAVIEEISSRKANVIQNVFELYKGRGYGATMKSADGTAWGALNAITQHFDHDSGWQSEKGNNARLRSNWFGPIGNKKVEAMNDLLTHIGYLKAA